MKASKQKEEIINSTKVTDKEFAGPFVKQLDEALQSFNIYRQQYLGGVLVGMQPYTQDSPDITNAQRAYWHGKHILDSVSWGEKEANPFMHLAKDVPFGNRSCETFVAHY